MPAGSYERKEFKGGAPPTTLIGSLFTSNITSFTVASATGWPAGTYPFVVVIDEGLTSEEKILVQSRNGTVLSGLTRGYDDTAISTHANGAVVRHVIDASSIDQANRLANILETKGQLRVHDGALPGVGPTPAQDGSDDGKVLAVDIQSPSGWSIVEVAPPSTLSVDGGSPSGSSPGTLDGGTP